MGSKRYEFKEVKWIIKYLKSQLDSISDPEADTDGGKYPDSFLKEGNHEKRHISNKGNLALTRKGELTKKIK